MLHSMIAEYQDTFRQSVFELILKIQREEFGMSITAEEQPDLADINGFYKTGKGNFWIALNGNEVIGTIALKDIGNEQTALRKMFVEHDWRGQEKSIATALLHTALKWAKYRGVKDIYLGTTPHFLAAHKFYERNGFQEIAKDTLPKNFPIMKVDTKFYAYSILSMKEDMPNQAAISISTPLGTLRGYTIEHPDLNINLSCKDHTPSLPSGMDVSECKILVWTISATRNCKNIKSVCLLEPIYDISGDRDTGEHLDCLTFENEKNILSLATDDGEYLNYRAKKKLLPDRFVTQHPDGLYSWVNYIKNGLEIVVPDLHARECVELRFSVAWKNKGETKDDISTWFAADLALN